MGNKVTTLGNVAINDLIDLGLRMPDGSTELFEVVNKRDDYVAVITKNIIDFMPFNASENKHSGKANSYAESSIRSYLVELYQSVAKENKLLETHTFGHKEFFLPTANALGFGDEVGKGWEAFKDDASRVKYPGTYAATKDEAYGPGESDWYWTSTPNAASASYVRFVYSNGTLFEDFAYCGHSGAAPALNLKSSAPVVLIDGVWHLRDADTSFNESKPKAVKAYNPVKAANAERVASDHYHDDNNGNDVWQFASDNFSGDRVKGFHQVNAIKDRKSVV